MGGLTVSPSCQDEFYIAKWMAKVALFLGFYPLETSHPKSGREERS